MQLAAKRLTDTNAKVASVAEAVGYDSEAAFSRAFKKVTGHSPREWRSASHLSVGDERPQLP
jgi:AraC-like DNA-binding protein